MLISIIIPVYNVEKYLEECIESFLVQEFKDYEIILINDGSIDDSGKICEKYSRKYPFISTIHKINGGLSDARNTGLRLIKGKYVLFVDSDDYIGKNSLTEIVKQLNSEKKDIDVMFLEAFKVFPNNKVISLGDGYQEKSIRGKVKDEVLNYLTSLPKFPASACTKLVRTSFIRENDLYFEKGLFSEDIDWTIKVLIKAESFSYCKVPYYYYRQEREGSITNSINLKKIESLIYIIEKWCKHKTNKKYQLEINSFMAYEYLIVIYMYSFLDKKDKIKLKNKIKGYRWLLKFDKSLKVRIVSKFYNYLGLDIVAFLLKHYYKFSNKIALFYKIIFKEK